MKTAWKDIKLLALDFDGVMTDGKVIVREDGLESVICSRRDSLGISMLKKRGVKVVVISKEKNGVVAARCKKIDIECFSGIDDKPTILKELLAREGVDPQHVCYVGDDVIDVECMRLVGIGVAVADAVSEAKEAADHVTSAKGGDHAVREVCDLILAAKK
jgi:YrbI family 3-deoxy-D-manno-octulosonate 8-phosphate phosphatase